MAELEAPPYSSFCRLTAYFAQQPVRLTLLLHAPARGVAAGLHVSVHSCLDAGDGSLPSDVLLLTEPGEAYAVADGEGGVDSFVSDLLEWGQWERRPWDGTPVLLALPEMPSAGDSCWAWQEAYVDWLPRAEVELRRVWSPGTRVHTALPDGGDPARAMSEGVSAATRIANPAIAYLRQQHSLAADFMPDPPEVAGQRYSELRDEAMRQLKAALSGALRHACRRRGAAPLPVPPRPTMPEAAGT